MDLIGIINQIVFAPKVTTKKAAEDASKSFKEKVASYQAKEAEKNSGCLMCLSFLLFLFLIGWGINGIVA